MTVHIASEIKSFPVCSHFNFFFFWLSSYLNSCSSKEAAIASEGSSLSKPSLPVRKYVGTAPNPYQKASDRIKHYKTERVKEGRLNEWPTNK